MSEGQAPQRFPDEIPDPDLGVPLIEDANRQMRAGSDEMLSIGSVLSFGFAMGLLIGGASRLLVSAITVPKTSHSRPPRPATLSTTMTMSRTVV